jgi:hypothetical protein
MRLTNRAFVLRVILRAIAVTAASCASGLAQTAPIADLPWLSLNGEMGSSGGARVSKRLGDSPWISGSANQSGGFRFGIQTEKSVQTPRSLRRSECTATDEECEEYSGLPKSYSGNDSTWMKVIKNQFLGLSVTSPLQ